MDSQPLNVKIDSSQARADLAQLAKALDTATGAVKKMESGFVTGMSGVDRSLKSSMSSMEKFAQVANLIGKIKLSGDPAQQIKAFAAALNTLSRAKAIDAAQITQIRTLSKTLAELRVPTQAQRLTTFLNAIGAAKAPTSSTVTRLRDLLKALSAYQGSSATRSTANLEAFFRALGAIKVPSEASIKRLAEMFNVLSSAKGLPSARKIVQDLESVAIAAGKASAALNAMPRNTRQVQAIFTGAQKGAAALHQELDKAPSQARKATAAHGAIAASLEKLTGRFNLGYQAGTLFSQFFAAFTVGEFLHKLYDVNIQLLKLQKAMLFQAGTMEGAAKATDQFIAITDNLGLSLEKSIEAYGRFAISAKASGLDLKQTNDIYRSVGTALQVVGANSNQTELAFYGLTQMMQKGKVVSEEFNRQIGEQIPGNAVIGAAALSKLEGRFISVGEFFQRMQKGLILSKTFVPEYARQLEAAYAPLLALVHMRPDAALNQLRNAFALFARQAGESGFMGALSRSLGDLRAKIVYVDKDGTEHLTKTAAQLAQSLGGGLARAIHLLGQGLMFLADHLREIVMVIKLLAALKVGSSFLEWGVKAKSFAADIAKVVTTSRADAAAAIEEAAARRAAAAAAKEQAVAAKAAALAARQSTASSETSVVAGAAMSLSPAMRGRIETTAALRANHIPLIAASGSSAYRTTTRAIPRTAITEAAGAAGGHFPRLSLGEALAAGGAMPSREISASIKVTSEELKAMSGAARAASVETKSFRTVLAGLTKGGFTAARDGLIGLGAVLPGIGTVAAAAAIALLVFSDSLTGIKTKLGSEIKIGDITKGWIDQIAGGVNGFFNSIATAFAGGGKQMEVDWGKVVAVLMASISAIVGGFVGLAQAIGTTLGGAIAASIDLLFGLARAFDDVLHGRFGHAKNVIGAIGNDLKNIGKDVAKSWLNAWDASDPEKHFAAIMEGAARSADKRAQASGQDLTQQKLYKDAEAQLAVQQEQQRIAQNQGELDQLNRRISLGDLDMPKFQDVLKQAANAASSTAVAATATAQAAQSAATASGAAVTAAKGVTGAPAAPAALAQAIADVSKKEGVDAGLLTRIAYHESKFDLNARPIDPKTGKPLSSALGAYQFTEGTAAAVGLPLNLRTDAMASTEAMAKLLKVNNAFLANHIGRDPTAGELYAAHFLGPSGATSLINAAKENPTASAASLFPQAAAGNASVFYADSKNRKNPFTSQQIIDRLNSEFGGQTGLAGKTIAGATQQDQQTLTQQFDSAIERYQRLVASHNPAEQSTRDYKEFILQTRDLLATQDKLKQQGLKPFIDPQALAREEERLRKLMDDAANPFAKDARLAQQANDVTAMRLKGMDDEADFQEKLNALQEQGYDISKLDLKTNRDLVKAAKDRADALKDQNDLLTAQNEASVHAISRRGNPVEARVAELVNERYQGGDLASKFQRAQEDNRLGSFRQIATTERNDQRDAAIQAISVQTSEMQATAHLPPSLKSFRDDYKSYLEQLSGISGQTLDYMVKQEPALAKIAERAAKLKYELENPPGFQKWADSLEPVAKRMEDIKAGFAEGLSEQITNALSGEHADFKGLLHDTAKQMLKAQVDQQLKGVMQMFGIVKPASPAEIAAQQQVKAASDVTAAAQSTDAAATNLNTSATNLNSAADKLMGAAQAIGAGGGGGVLGASGASSAMSPQNAVNTVASVVSSTLDKTLPSIAGITSAADAGDGTVAPITITGQGREPLKINASGMPLLDNRLPDFSGFLPQGGGAAGGSSGGASWASILGGQGSTGPFGTVPAVGNLLNSALNPMTLANGVFGDKGVLGGIFGNKGALGAITGSKGIFGQLGGLPGLAATGILAGITSLLGHKKQPYAPGPAVNGVIGQYGGVDVTGTEVAGHANIIGSILSTVVGVAGGKGGAGSGILGMLTKGGGGGGGLGSLFGGGGGGSGGLGSLFSGMGQGASGILSGVGQGASGFLNGIGSFLAGLFAEGGMATSPAARAAHPIASFHNAPHFSEGTTNTSGIPAILHPNEAVIPLSRGRKIPVEMGDGGMGGSTIHVNSNITVVAPDPNAFRQSRGSIQRQQNRDLKRAAVRNLNPH